MSRLRGCLKLGGAFCLLLVHRRDKILHPSYYASKALNAPQENCTITEQVLLAVVFTFKKIAPTFLARGL